MLEFLPLFRSFSPQRTLLFLVLFPPLEAALLFVLVVCWRGGIDHGRQRFQEPRSQQSLRRGSGSYLQEKVPNDECGGTSRPVSQMQPLALVAIVEIKAAFVALLSGGEAEGQWMCPVPHRPGLQYPNRLLRFLGFLIGGSASSSGLSHTALPSASVTHAVFISSVGLNFESM